MAVRIIGTGSSLPGNIVDNRELSRFVDTSDEWIRERTGIGERHISTGETVVSLSAEACERALENAGRDAGEVELLLVATCSPERNIPCAACQVQSRIGAGKAVAFDLNAACSGFLFALHTACAYVEAGMYANALVAGGEVLSKLVDWTDRGTCILFGDGAGAVYVEKADRGGILGYVQHSDGARGNVLTCDTRGLKNPYADFSLETAYIQMDGREVFSFAMRTVPAGILEVLEKTRIPKEDIDLFLLHQANQRIIDGIARRLNVDPGRFPSNVSRVGNMSSASIPVLLDELNRKGALKEGMKLALSGFGAGLTYGACVMEW